jgi:hypothetical protein
MEPLLRFIGVRQTEASFSALPSRTAPPCLEFVSNLLLGGRCNGDTIFFMTYQKVHQDLKKLANPVKAKLLARFFKTGKGEYGEGDIFLGIMVPRQREVVKKFCDLSLPEIQKLLNSKFHEERLVGVLILVEQYRRVCHSDRSPSDSEGEVEESLILSKRDRRRDSSTPLRCARNDKEEIYKFYLKKAKKINNWDLVDLSAPKIVGAYLQDKDRKILYKLVKSKNLWERRIAVLATFWFIREKDFKDAIRLAEILLTDKHDLIHKAVGWMLREIGKRDEKVLRQFLNQHTKKMPRTMLRYSIEKLPEKDRRHYLDFK